MSHRARPAQLLLRPLLILMPEVGVENAAEFGNRHAGPVAMAVEPLLGMGSGCRAGRAMRKTVCFGRWRSKRTVFRGLGSEKRTFLPVVRVWAFR